VHRQQAGSREAVKQFTAYLEDAPEDLRARWLLNIASMTLGEYPQRVPAAYLVPLDRFRSKLDVGRFDNVATAAGLGVRGPRQAGGSIFDDFNNDGWPDLLVTSIDAEEGASMFSSTTVTVPSRIARRGRTWATRSSSSTSPMPTLITTATSTFC
jgi:hypothetical protein